MSAVYDLSVLPVGRRAGLDLADLPGLSVAERPRRLARGRDADRLILFLHFKGELPPALNNLQQTLASLAKTYYEVPGSVTHALRTTAASLNKALFERNLAMAGQAEASATLTMLVLRDDQLTLAQSGSAMACLIQADATQSIGEDYLPALGRQENVPIIFYQAVLKPNDSLLIAPGTLPWDIEGLTGLHGHGPESIRRRILAQSGLDLEAVLVQARPGQGNISLLRSVAAVEMASATSAPIQLKEDLPQQVPTLEVARSTPTQADQAEPVQVFDEFPSSQASPARDLAGQTSKVTGQAGRAAGSFLTRMLPEDSLAGISNTTLALIAILIPVIVVTIAVVFYFQRGIAAEAEAAYAKAVDAVTLAEAQTDLQKQREAWTMALGFLENAEQYQVTQEGAALRSKVQGQLDNLNLVRRLDYQPAVIGGLPATVQVGELLQVNEDLYMLDTDNGNVIRAVNQGQGYQLDPSFVCGPSAPGFAGPIIDITAWPAGSEPPGDLVGMDGAGKLIFCAENVEPIVHSLKPPDGHSFSGLAGFTQNNGHLYVLEPAANAVWIYWQGDYEQEPQFYFGNEVPPLQDIVDLAVSGDELYLLHQDGHLTLCEFSGIAGAPTRCIDPAPFIDARPGFANIPLVLENPFGRLMTTPSPDSSLYLLQPANQSVNRMSLKQLVYQRQYAPLEPLPGGEATAFTVDPLERIIYLATGNNVFYARVPP
jgi:hypothetical protein